MRLYAIIVFFCLIVTACGNKMYMYEFSGSVVLKDKSMVSYDLRVEFKNQKGVDELEEKLEKINHAIRIILVQRNKEQIDRKSRLISVVSKIFKSQLTEPVSHITVTNFNIETMK